MKSPWIARFARVYQAFLHDVQPQFDDLEKSHNNSLQPLHQQPEYAVDPKDHLHQPSQPYSASPCPPDSYPVDLHNERADTLTVIEADDHRSELAAVGKVLILLERQLQNLNSDVENSVVGICSGFGGMAQRAQAAVATAKSAVIDDPSSIDSNPILQMQSVLESLLKNVQASCQFSQNAATKLMQLEQRLASVERIVGEVEDISGRAKMVALNGRIEAARLGEAGKAFGVVAQETKDLADKAAQTSQTIRHSVTQLAVELAGTTAEMRLRAESDTITSQETELIARELLKNLASTHQQMSHAIEQTVEISTALQGDIAKAVMSLQFQDRVSQCVFHVVETLSGVAARIEPWWAGANSLEVQQYFDDWKREIEARYTMNSEREIMLAPSAQTSDHASRSIPDKNELLLCSVELF